MCPEDIRRRRFLSRAFAIIQTAIGATVAFVMGGTVVGPAFGAKRANWWPAATMSDLIDGEPTPVTIRRAHTDGYRQTVNREVVFLIKTNDKVTALSSTCTHLGCRVAWDAERRGAEVSLSRRHVRPRAAPSSRVRRPLLSRRSPPGSRAIR